MHHDEIESVLRERCVIGEVGSLFFSIGKLLLGCSPEQCFTETCSRTHIHMPLSSLVTLFRERQQFLNLNMHTHYPFNH